MPSWNLGKSISCPRAKYVLLDSTRFESTLHLFRALLRQSGYLPDPAARQWFRRHIVFRFRQHHPPSDLLTDKRGKTRSGLGGSRYVTLLRTARKGLVFLQRANDGHPRHLKKILAMTYGRIGKRRHELLKPFRVPDVPMDQAALLNISSPASQNLPLLSRKLQALVKSHSHRKLSFFSRPIRPTLEPKIPEKNAWGRPMPMRRVRNMRRRWYGLTLDNVMPPLPETEWNRLRGLASGEIQWDGPVPRRCPFEQPGYKRDVVRGTIESGAGFVSSPHQLTSRYMRRLWTKIFLQCPLMSPDESKQLGWTVQWGNTQSAKGVRLLTRSQENANMFEGVNEYGKVLSNT